MVNSPSKSVQSLVKDMLSTVDTGVDISPEDTQEFGNTLSTIVASRLSPDRQPGGYLRPSNIGEKCDRKLWYSINKPELAEPLTPVTRLKFLLGDVVEALLLFLAKVSGHEVSGQQDTVGIGGVVGSRDAVIDGMLVDVKSASSYSFDKFRNHLNPDTDAFGYLDQINFYLAASQDDDKVRIKNRAAFLAMDKQHAHLALDVHEIRLKDWEHVIKKKREMLDSPSVPERGYEDVADGSSGNRKLGVACSYCPFKHSCYPGLRTFLYSNGPRFLTVVKREPNVTEILDT